MRGSRIQAIVRELNNEKIDIVNYSEQPEILVSRALSPAKPVQLFIDDEKNYCVALFEDENLDAAIGRNGMNINLASKITEYRIDAYGVKQYERIQEDHKTALSEIEGVSSKVSAGLATIGINVVSELLDAEMEVLLSAKGVDENSLDTIYEAVQTFVERELEIETEDDDSEDFDFSSLEKEDGIESDTKENDDEIATDKHVEESGEETVSTDQNDTSSEELGEEDVNDDEPIAESTE